MLPIIGWLLFIHKKSKGSFLGTVSATLADTPKSSLIFAMAMTILFPLYYACLYFWVGPLLQVPSYYYYILLFSAVCEFIFVWVPAVPGIKSQIHTLASIIVGLVTFIIPTIVLVNGENVNNFSKYSVIIFLTISLLMLTSLAVKKLRKYSLIYEIAYMAIFVVCIGIIAHS